MSEEKTTFRARCKNCSWRQEGRSDLYGDGENTLSSALYREHYESQTGPVMDPGCQNSEIVIEFS